MSITDNITSIRRYLSPEWVKGVSINTMRADALAGFTSATVVLPQAIAFSAIAGLPPQYGLYTAIVPPILAAIFGSSRIMVSGPTLVMSAVMFSALSAKAMPGSSEFVAQAIVLTLMVGVLQYGFGLLQLGRLVNFVSHSVMIGFTAAAAVLIALTQLKDVLGIAVERGGTIIDTVAGLAQAAHTSNVAALLVSAVTLATLILLRVFAQRFPAFILALVVGGVFNVLIDGEQRGLRMVGELPSVIPIPALPHFTFAILRDLGQAAFAIALLGLLEAASIGKAFSSKTNSRFEPNREIIAQGLSNIGGSIFQCYASSGSFTRSGVNFEAGARTPMAAILASFFLVVILLIIAPLLSRIPVPAVAAIILYVAFRLIDIAMIRHILTTSRSESWVIASTLGAGLFVSLEFAILGGVALSLFIFLSRTAKPDLAIQTLDPSSPQRSFWNAKLRGLPECPQTVFARLDGSLYFGSVDYLDREFEKLSLERREQRHLVLILRGVGGIDLPAAELLIDESRRRKALGGKLHIVARYPPLQRKLEQFHVIEAIGEHNLFQSKGDAIAALVPRLDQEICKSCSARIFLECPGRAP